jgi:hypothetical protein
MGLNGNSIQRKVVVCLLVNLLFLGSCRLLIAGSPKMIKYQPRLVLFIDFNDLMCFNCLSAFFRFCQSLPSYFLQEKTIGVLVVDQDNLNSRGLLVIKKKLRGFTYANKIEFPVWIDTQGIFEHFSGRGTSLLLMGESMDLLQFYSFPLLPHQENEILNEILASEEWDGVAKKKLLFSIKAFSEMNCH